MSASTRTIANASSFRACPLLLIGACRLATALGSLASTTLATTTSATATRRPIVAKPRGTTGISLILATATRSQVRGHTFGAMIRSGAAAFFRTVMTPPATTAASTSPASSPASMASAGSPSAMSATTASGMSAFTHRL
mmetsp:Transcript_2695/g.8450  ORF Transcript_2695/g.8450 Transcript_2695/m.8450 type:complete len:139 (-) Transcript_2695:88-504(-)